MIVTVFKKTERGKEVIYMRNFANTVRMENDNLIVEWCTGNYPASAYPTDRYSIRITDEILDQVNVYENLQFKGHYRSAWKKIRQNHEKVVNGG